MYEKELEFAKQLAVQAGKIMRENFVLVGEGETTWKENISPLTFADTEINSLVITESQKQFPHYAVLGEEESFDMKNAEYLWVCDPIDGTIPFSHGWPTFAFSLALCKEGVPVVGVVYDAMMDRLLTAAKGQGAEVNGKQLRIFDRSLQSKRLFIGVNTWHNSAQKSAYLYERLIGLGYGVQNLESATYMQMLVALSKMVAAVYPGKDGWDSAANKVIIEEAGGKVTDMFGNEQRYDGTIKGVLATNGFMHEKMLEIIHAK